jgi:hypothetical protein
LLFMGERVGVRGKYYFVSLRMRRIAAIWAAASASSARARA